MRRASAILASLVFGAAAPAFADDTALLEKIRALETRVQELEANRDELLAAADSASSPRPAEADRSVDTAGPRHWSDRIRFSGSASTGWLDGEEYGAYSQSSFQVWDARLFVEADLANDVKIDERTLVRDVGLLFEWDLVRLGTLQNDVGELYADFRGLFDNGWLNAQMGRFLIPVGENYLRFGQGYRDNPFITNTVGGPWWWDEGVRLYGSAEENRYGYVASVSNGETPFNRDADSDTQLTLKLFANPFDWLHLSVSTLRSGTTGSETLPASGALWLGESWARAFGMGSALPNFHDGAAVADGPNVIEGTWLLGGDVILRFRDLARLWLAYGTYDIESEGPSLYDRSLRYWIAELLLEGKILSPSLERFYLGLRGSGLGTYDRGEGYLLDFRYAPTVGYNMSSLQAYSIVAGFRIAPGVTLRAEYTRNLIDLVRGVTEDIREAGPDNDFFGVDMELAF